MRHGGAMMPDALRWLWREYPKPIEVREPPAPNFPRPPQAATANPNAPRFTPPPGGPRGAVYAIVSLDKPWQQVGETYKSVASPAADKDGNVYFADPASNRIYKSDANGKVAIFKDNTNGATALRVGADGRLYASQLARKRIVSYGTSGDEKTVANNVEANDLALTAKGEIYFVDIAHRTVNLLDARGKTRVVIKLRKHFEADSDHAFARSIVAEHGGWTYEIHMEFSGRAGWLAHQRRTVSPSRNA